MPRRAVVGTVFALLAFLTLLLTVLFLALIFSAPGVPHLQSGGVVFLTAGFSVTVVLVWASARVLRHSPSDWEPLNRADLD